MERERDRIRLNEMERERKRNNGKKVFNEGQEEKCPMMTPRN